MTTLKEVKEYFVDGVTRQVSSECAGYQFVKRKDGTMFLFTSGKYKFYRTFDGFCRAVLWRMKRG